MSSRIEAKLCGRPSEGIFLNNIQNNLRKRAGDKRSFTHSAMADPVPLAGSIPRRPGKKSTAVMNARASKVCDAIRHKLHCNHKILSASGEFRAQCGALRA